MTKKQIAILLDSVKSAAACLKLFEIGGEYTVSVPDFAPPEEYAHNVRNAHVRAAREARKLLENAMVSPTGC